MSTRRRTLTARREDWSWEQYLELVHGPPERYDPPRPSLFLDEAERYECYLAHRDRLVRNLGRTAGGMPFPVAWAVRHYEPELVPRRRGRRRGRTGR